MKYKVKLIKFRKVSDWWGKQFAFVIEQITYLLFIRGLDEVEMKKENDDYKDY